MLAVRLALAAVLLVSGIAKLVAPSATRAGSRALGLPEVAARASVVALPVVELGTAVLLAVTPWATAGGALATVMMTAFTIVILVNLVRGRRPSCACFGGLSAGAPIGASTVVRNAALLAASVAVFVAGLLPGRCTVGCYDAAGARDVAIGGAVAGALAIAGCLLLVHTLTAAVGTLTRRVRDLEAAGTPAPAHGPAPRPRFDPAALTAALPRTPVTTPDGATVSAADIVPTDRPALLLFLSRDCSACARLTRQLTGSAAPPALPIVGLIDTWDGAHRGATGDRLSVYAEGGALAEQVGITAFPTAVPLRADGTPRGDALTGTTEIQRFLTEGAFSHV